jgi:hypothetical protein
MDDMRTGPPVGWGSQACTLPAPQRPLRLAEFDDLFATAVRSVARVDARRLRLDLAPKAAVAARMADLAVRETGCCSFFTFTLTATGGQVWLEVSVPDGQVEVLDALAAAAAGVGSRAAKAFRKATFDEGR